MSAKGLDFTWNYLVQRGIQSQSQRSVVFKCAQGRGVPSSLTTHAVKERLSADGLWNWLCLVSRLSECVPVRVIQRAAYFYPGKVLSENSSFFSRGWSPSTVGTCLPARCPHKKKEPFSHDGRPASSPLPPSQPRERSVVCLLVGFLRTHPFPASSPSLPNRILPSGYHPTMSACSSSTVQAESDLYPNFTLSFLRSQLIWLGSQNISEFTTSHHLTPTSQAHMIVPPLY